MPSSSTSSKNFSSIDQTVRLLQRAQFVTLCDFSINLSTSYLCTGSRYNAENFISSTSQQTLLAMKISAFHNEAFVHNRVDKIDRKFEKVDFGPRFSQKPNPRFRPDLLRLEDLSLLYQTL